MEPIVTDSIDLPVRIAYDVNGNFTGMLNKDGSLAPYYPRAAVWSMGEVSSVLTPSIIADGAASSAPDNQVPLAWRIVVNAADQITGAQLLLDGNCFVLNPGDVWVPPIDVPVENVMAVCTSTLTARPAAYTGTSYIIPRSGATLADVLSIMAVFEFSSALGATYVLASASQVYDTNFAQLHVQAGTTA